MGALEDEIERLRAALAVAEEKAAEAARLQAVLSSTEALIASLKLQIAKLRRERYGQRSERTSRLLGQLELQLEELEATAAEDEREAEKAAAKTTIVQAFERRRPKREPFPEHLPRERVVVEAPASCGCCGSERLVKLGEDVTETLEVIPRQWKVVQTVRERFTCRDCEGISQPPAPFHPTPRGWAGPSLLAMILFEKFGCHQPLNRQAERYAREGVELSLSTLADQVGACAVTLAPLHALIEAHVLTAERLHGDDTGAHRHSGTECRWGPDTPVPVLAKTKTATGRLWVYVRDDRPFGGGPPAALFKYSRDRRGEHPQCHLTGWSGILQADAYGGFGPLYEAERQPGPVIEAPCWSHARRRFFELADIAKNRRKTKPPPISPIALEVQRIDAIFAIERGINGADPTTRLAVRRAEPAPLVQDLGTWLRAEREKLSRHAPVAKAIDYMLKRWDRFTRFLGDGRICVSNNAAERALRGIALGRKSWLFAGSDRGGDRAAFMYTLIETAKLNGVDPQAWLADVLARIADTPLSRLDELLPWNWRPTHQALAA